VTLIWRGAKLHSARQKPAHPELSIKATDQGHAINPKQRPKASYPSNNKANKKEDVMFLRGSILAGAVALVASSVSPASAQGVFTLTSPSFKDGERLATKFAGNNKTNPNCVGENVSPALSWANPPAGTKSFAIFMFDPEGRPPGGVSHWVAYGIPASVTGFAEGEVSKASEKYVGGTSLMKLATYFGPCTPPGPIHHYTLTLMATDLDPKALAPGLERADAQKALDGHVLQATGLIGTFSKP
jgi:Raf kinase inhibitor-like YbhB/YbcL family protein